MPAIAKHLPSIGIVVEYCVYDPINDKMKRKRIRLERALRRLRTKRERMVAAHKVAETINSNLKGGWSPLYESTDSRLYTRLPDLQAKFLAAKKAEGCRATTLVQYKSVTDLWLRWCEDNGLARLYSGTYLRANAVLYMDDMLERSLRHRSYNNTMKVMKAFWQWAVDHLYAKENPFAGLKTLKKEPKIRILEPPEARRLISEYYAATRPAMNIVCQLVYSSAIRPAEILRIQMKHIHLDARCITIPGENAKNHKQRSATLTAELIRMLEPLVARFRDGELFLIGKNEELEPDTEPVNKSYFQKSWERMRRATGLPKEMQLYSLRDTGITDLLHAGVDPLTVQHHADHSSLDIQHIYTDHFDPGLNEKIYSNAPKF